MTQKEGRLKIREFLHVVKRDDKGAIILPTLDRAVEGGRVEAVLNTPRGASRRGCDQGPREVRPQGLPRLHLLDRLPGRLQLPLSLSAITPTSSCGRRRLADMPVDFFLAYLDAPQGLARGRLRHRRRAAAAPRSSRTSSRSSRSGACWSSWTPTARCPDRLRGRPGAGLVDWVAMDIKAPLERYREVTGVRTSTRRTSSGAPTSSASLGPAVPVPDDGRPGPGRRRGHRRHRPTGWTGRRVFQIQQFSPVERHRPRITARSSPIGRDEVRRMAAVARPYFGEVRIEGPDILTRRFFERVTGRWN